jgi:hypothetical protein
MATTKTDVSGNGISVTYTKDGNLVKKKPKGPRSMRDRVQGWTDHLRGVMKEWKEDLVKEDVSAVSKSHTRTQIALLSSAIDHLQKMLDEDAKQMAKPEPAPPAPQHDWMQLKEDLAGVIQKRDFTSGGTPRVKPPEFAGTLVELLKGFINGEAEEEKKG